jgi:hypothetical protein
MKTIADIKRKHVGSFFLPETMRFFGSKIESKLYLGGYFITSEKDWSGKKRAYTVRLALDNGDIETLSKFLEFSEIEDARKFIKKCQKEYVDIYGGF